MHVYTADCGYVTVEWKGVTVTPARGISLFLHTNNGEARLSIVVCPWPIDLPTLFIPLLPLTALLASLRIVLVRTGTCPAWPPSRGPD
jgi:hypothetical protein